jgi:hypothetical protein
LPGAEAGVAAAIEAADLAQAAGAHEVAVAFLTSAVDLAGPDDAWLTTVRSRLGLALAWALHFDEAVEFARDAAARIAQGEGAHAAAGYLAQVTAALGAAGSSAHAWQLAPAGLAYAGSSRDEPWAALTLLALDRKEAADPDHVGLPLDESRRRQALAVLYRSPQPVTRSVDLARHAVAAIYQQRDSVPAEAAQDPTVLLYLLGALRPALPAFEKAAAQARARGELAREVHCRASISRALAALGDLGAARAALAETRELAGRIPGKGWSWERIHVEGARDALTLATAEDWGRDTGGLRRARWRGGSRAAVGPGPDACRLCEDRCPSWPGRTGHGDAGAARSGAKPGTCMGVELRPDGFGHRRDAVGARPT